MNKINRILIFGNSGSGKSTLAKELENALNIPCYEIDNFRWQKNWIRVSQKTFESNLDKCASMDTWIDEDGSEITLNKFKDQADVIIWLQTNIVLCLVRLIKRSILRWSGYDSKNPEPIIMALKHWRHCLKYKFYKKDQKFKKLLSKVDNKIIIIKNKKEKQNLITDLKEQSWEN